jgi:general secretion pathway protein F
MAVFRYKALAADGQALQGRMEAASAEEVALKLQEAGHLPIEAVRADAGGAGGGLAALAAALKPGALDAEAVLRFTQQLATLTGAGQPLDRALAILLEQPEDEAARRVLQQVREQVRGGSTLSAALEAQHGVFPRLYVAMVRAGEAGGSLHETLERLAEYLERSRELRASVINALVYPAILVAMVAVAVVVLFAWVVPQFRDVFAGLGDPDALPWLTRAMFGASDVMLAWGWLLPLGAVALVAFMLGRLRDPAARLALDGRLLGLRILGPLLARLETARLARTLGTLLRHGVPLLQALGIARNVLGNRALAAAVEQAQDEVKTGGGLARALARPKLFPRLALQMVQVGEETGELDGMLLKVADTFDRETRQAMDRLLSALVPLVTIAMALVVGVVVLAILVPLYDMTNSIG